MEFHLLHYTERKKIHCQSQSNCNYSVLLMKLKDQIIDQCVQHSAGITNEDGHVYKVYV